MIKVVFFARLRELLNTNEVNIEFSEMVITNNSGLVYVSDLVNTLKISMPAFRDYLENGNQVLAAVNQQTADFDTLISAGVEVAFFPPVTGG